MPLSCALQQSEGGPPEHELYDHYDRKFPPPEPNKKVKRIPAAASVMQFAATNYYHFIMEVLPLCCCAAVLLHLYNTSMLPTASVPLRLTVYFCASAPHSVLLCLTMHC